MNMATDESKVAARGWEGYSQKKRVKWVSFLIPYTLAASVFTGWIMVRSFHDKRVWGIVVACDVFTTVMLIGLAVKPSFVIAWKKWFMGAPVAIAVVGAMWFILRPLG